MKLDLKNGTVLLDDEDWDRLKEYRWYINKYTKAVVSPGISRSDPSTVAMARVIMKAPKHLVVDHINGNRLDNRKSNLRLSTQQRNTWNRQPNKTKNRKERPSSKFRGVQKTKRLGFLKWTASISVFRNTIFLGIFNSEEEAASAFDIAAKMLFNDTYSRPNLQTQLNVEIQNLDLLEILKKRTLFR